MIRSIYKKQRIENKNMATSDENKRPHILTILMKYKAVISTLFTTIVISISYSSFSNLASKSPLTSSSSSVSIPNNPMGHPDSQERISHFKETAKSFSPITDKIGGTSEHRYHNMYGQFLLPFAANKPDMKFLEIGLGCNMAYGPGASVQIWKKLFPLAELWEAEYVEECVETAEKKNQLDDIHVLVGDQADKSVLDSWVEKSGGKFDIIIDDGGHHNCQIHNSFQKLWPQLNPGGYYFIEDLHVSLAQAYIHKKEEPHLKGYLHEDCDNNIVMSKVISQWQQQLIFKTLGHGVIYEHKLPPDMLFVHCQAEACVLGKRKDEVNDPLPR